MGKHSRVEAKRIRSRPPLRRAAFAGPPAARLYNSHDTRAVAGCFAGGFAGGAAPGGASRGCRY